MDTFAALRSMRSVFCGVFPIGKEYQPVLPFGYAQVSTQYQTLYLQDDKLEKAGCKRLFTNTVSGEAKQKLPYRASLCT
jgi:hypothetical protein